MTANNQTTELVFILDRSGSMSGLEPDTIGGFNGMIESQKKDRSGKVYVSTILFDNVSEVLHDRIELEKIPRMTDRDYTVRGCTALLDAIGSAIHHVKNIHKYARPEDVPAHTLFVITTDGMENASHRYSHADVKQMIEQQKKDAGWEFMFIGANIDAMNVASTIGIQKERAVNYNADSIGTAKIFKALAPQISRLRSNAKMEDNWAEEIAEDHRTRKQTR
ncbi:MAG: hypothetical protein MJ071_03585 [Oscillospiraceae bacterium]|nr:hypothetical protein [Oscillospiraceae bacterium]